MLSTLYISLPSKTVAGAQGDWMSLGCPFALMSNEGLLQQHGERPFAQMAEFIPKARQVVMLLAASDVTVLQIKAPPLSAARLKAALPNLVEDQLASDPAGAVLVSTSVQDGSCTVAAVDKKWMEFLAGAVLGFGARKVSAYASQLCFELAPDASSVFINSDHGAVEFALRSAALEGFGLTLTPEGDQHAVAEVVQALQLFAPEGKLTLYVPALQQPDYQQACEHDASLASRVTVKQSSWAARIATAGVLSAGGKSALDLMEGVSLPDANKLDLRAWRWPLLLGAAALLVNVLGLNIEWMSMKREAKGLSDSLTQSFRASYPKETVLRPLDQMKQKISLSRKLAGQSSPDDFVVMAAQFSQVWDRVFAAAGTVSVISMEYRERSLFVKVKAQGMLPVEQLRAALAEQSLALVSSADGVLQIKPTTAITAAGAGNAANRSRN
ncbi:type II secretion system protein GspL [Undibacterium sp. TJN25]|uniref:type II secretion system protein GspL n=1 Tax=Undibacterium sp. TJN25 TaxID=3413056 RepID=UPI003BEFE3DC